MPLPTLDNTLMGQLSNSYVDQAYADAYFAAHFNAIKRDGWAALTADQKTNALIQACAILEGLKFTEPQTDYFMIPHLDPVTLMYRQVTDAVVKWSSIQRLQFPRNIDANYADQMNPYIPDAIIKAQCEQAYFLTVIDDSGLQSMRQGVRSEALNADGISVSTHYVGQGDMLAPIVVQLVKQYFLPPNRRYARA